MRIHNIDLHYHAGCERQPGTTLRDYFLHARVSGRKIIGITDHLNRYLPGIDPERDGMMGIADLEQFRAEVDALKPAFPDICVLFAPEISSRQSFDEIPARVAELADFFICEPPDGFGEDPGENTRGFIRRIAALRRYCREAGKPAYIAHPFRNSINRRLVKFEVERWVTEFKPGNGSDFIREEITRFLLLDPVQVGGASSKYGIPIEVNGGTQQRARASNLPRALELLWQAFRLIRDEGAGLVPGSDLHGILSGVGRMGLYVPADCFEMLGLEAGDISFLDNFPEVWDQSSVLDAVSGSGHRS